MAAIVFRLALLAAGLGLTEIGLANAIQAKSLADWLIIGMGMVMLVAGSASFMGTLLGVGRREG
jgi:hypothetical protein